MGLFDKLLGRSAETKGSRQNISQREPESAVAPSIISRAIAERDYHLSQAVKIPLNDAAWTSGALMQLSPALKAVWTGNKIGNNSLVRVVFPAGVKGNLAIDKDGLALGSILKDGGGLAQARLAAVNPAVLAAQAAMAGILMEVHRKLDHIQETQQSILDFLEQDKQAEQQANLNVLNSILESYRQNWDNAQYLQNHHMKVLDIKQTAEKNLIFYQKRIASEIVKMPAFYLDKAVKDVAANLREQFSNYRIAVYVFSFASLLEVMLLGNFREEYLDQVAAKVQEYNQHYQTQFSQCCDRIKRYASKSVETKVLGGIGSAEKTLGKFIGSVPLLAQGPVDEWLQEKGKKLLKGNNEKTNRTMKAFSSEEKTDSEMFVENIRHVSAISNQVTDVLFDKEALYLVVA